MALHRRANFLSVGGYNESLKHSEEYELYLRLSYRSASTIMMWWSQSTAHIPKQNHVIGKDVTGWK